MYKLTLLNKTKYCRRENNYQYNILFLDEYFEHIESIGNDLREALQGVAGKFQNMLKEEQIYIININSSISIYTIATFFSFQTISIHLKSAVRKKIIA